MPLEYDSLDGAPYTVLVKRCYDFHMKGGISASLGGITCSYPDPGATGDNGNLFQVQDKNDDNRTQNFTYDVLNRITSGYTNGPNWGQNFTIDAWGNLTNAPSITGKANPSPLNAAPASVKNQLPGLSYDAAGNVTSDGLGHTFTFDAENRVSCLGSSCTSPGVWNYTYDGDGKRLKKSNGSTGTLYWTGAGSDTMAESDLSGTINEEYMYFNGQRVARVDRPSGTVHYYVNDRLGTARIVATPSSYSTVTFSDSDYSPYGVEIPVSGSDPNHYKFTGKERDTESGLDNFGARYDASSMGRFMTPDPLMASAKVWDPQTWNRYAYALNNPLKYVDPTGMNEVTAAQCAQDKNCVTVNVNVIYDKNANDGKGLTDKQKADFEKGQLQSAKDQYGNADIHLNVTYSEGAFSTDNGGKVSGLRADALNVVVTDQVDAPQSKINGKYAFSFIPANSTDNSALPHEMAHQFMGDTQGWRNWVMTHDPVYMFAITLNAVTDYGNDFERAWMRNIDQHSGPLSYYPLASAFHHNAAVFQRSIQPTTKP